jgi:hypothetical protein
MKLSWLEEHLVSFAFGASAAYIYLILWFVFVLMKLFLLFLLLFLFCTMIGMPQIRSIDRRVQRIVIASRRRELYRIYCTHNN